MCTRYFMELSPELKPYVDRARGAALTGRMVAKLGRPLKTEGEIRPTDIAPVIAPNSNDRKPSVFPMVWGFTNPKEGGTSLVNCRVETAKSKPFWKDSWKSHRCIIPASYYFEWEHLSAPDGQKKPGQKYMLQPKGCTVMYLAGLYAIEERAGIRIPVFTVLTRAPGREISFIHDRMPVILSKDDAWSWVDPMAEPYGIAGNALTDLYFEKTI